MKVLLVDPDSSRASSLADALTAGGAHPTVAPSASFALTMLEWNQQDVIVSRAKVGDMDGHELCAFVRADPSTKSVKFVLVANDVTPAQAAQIGIDLVIPDGLVGPAIVTRVMHLMRRDADAAPAASASAARASIASATPTAPGSSSPPASSPASPLPVPPRAPLEAPSPIEPPVQAPPPPPPPPAPPPSVPAPAEPPTSTPARPIATPASKAPTPVSPSLSELEAVGLNGAMRTFQGPLGSLKLEDLTQAIAAGGKTGRLLLVLGTGGGMVAFDNGRIVHAEVGNTTGETAFQTLVTAAHREAGGKFCFIPSAPRDLANVPKTITRSVPDLLRGAARAMDEEN
jgi:CheY-like chemotaxis protein